jgi:AraC-like DNA-binding protein
MENSSVLQRQHQFFSDFYLCYCGYSHCAPHHRFGPAARPNYLIHIILDGKGTFRTSSGLVQLRAGEGFFIRPDEQAFFEADGSDPWTYLWIGFHGARCAEYMQEIGFQPEQQTFSTPDGEALREIVQQMLQHNTAGIENDFILQGLLCQFFACLARSLSQPLSAANKDDRENFYVRRAVEFVHYNYANHITVADMAKYVSLNRSYLFTLFQRVLHVSPQEFLTTYRLTRAKEQLALTNTAVSAIAQSVGYRDPLVFSKAFKNLVGMTPIQYRRQQQDIHLDDVISPQTP